MEFRRRHEKNKIQTEMSDIKNFNTADTATMARFRTSGVNLEFNKKQIEKLLKNIEQRENKLEELSERLQKLQRGELDAELEKESTMVKMDIKRKNDEKKKMKAEIAESKKQDKEKSNAYYQANRSIDRQNRRTNKDINWGYKYFKRTCDSVPDYMRKKLANMPENKGYIWKKVFCYGERPAEKGQPISMFERPRGGDKLIIHEWTATDYKVYEKIGKGRKKLVQSTKRKEKQGNNTLSAYL